MIQLKSNYFSLSLPSFSETQIDLSPHDASLRNRFQSKEIGFYDWPSTISDSEVAEINRAADQIRKHSEGALFFGIGGSYLGAECLIQALWENANDFPTHWLVNVDRTSIYHAERFCKNRKITPILISKSGNTTELLSGFYRLSSKLDLKQSVGITDPNQGELRKLIKDQKWTSFPVPENIGGRFSVLTAVGLLPMAVKGINIGEVLKGAREMRDELESQKPETNPAYLYAKAKYLWNTIHKRNVFVLMPYESALRTVSDWYVQLWAESIGKRLRNNPGVGIGFTPLPALGTADQHSMLQLFKEGPQDKVIGFIDVFGKTKTPVTPSSLTSDAFKFLTNHTFEEINHEACLATEKSLQNSGVPTYRFQFDAISPKALGAFLFFQMTACAFAGELYQINAFDQPGVEEAKKLLRAAL